MDGNFVSTVPSSSVQVNKKGLLSVLLLTLFSVTGRLEVSLCVLAKVLK